MKVLLSFFLLTCSCLADIVTLKLNSEVLMAPKTTLKTSYTIFNSYTIRRKIDPTNNLLYPDLGIQVDTLNKDAPWKLVLTNLGSKNVVNAEDRMSINVIASSRVGKLNTITPAVTTPDHVFLLGDVVEYRVVKLSLKLEDGVCEVYGAFNVSYRVVRNITGDHWYPSLAFSFKAPGSYKDSTCVGTFTFLPPRISVPTSYWTNVNTTLIISK